MRGSGISQFLRKWCGLNLFTNRWRRSRSARVQTKLDERTTAEIGEAWTLTAGKLEDCASNRERLRLAELRETYLDELARRDPEGFQRWLDDSLGGVTSRPDTYIHADVRTERLHRHRRFRHYQDSDQ